MYLKNKKKHILYIIINIYNKLILYIYINYIIYIIHLLNSKPYVFINSDLILLIQQYLNFLIFSLKKLILFNLDVLQYLLQFSILFL